jgi:dTDP-4-dehydrorhamnose reductase
MRVLLTGTSGQVGGALRPLLQETSDLIAPTHAEFDLGNPATLTAALDRMSPEIIINPAAYTAVDRAEDERDTAYRVNAEAVAVIARWAAKRRVPLIHFSTDYVFDGSGDQPWREDAPTGPLSVYGASKLAGEQAIADAGASHLIIRTSWVYAAEGTNFLQTIARLAGEREELRIVADQIGAPTSAKAIAQSIISILGSQRSDLVGSFIKSQGIVNVACTGQTSWYGFASAIVSGLKARNVKLKVETVTPIAAKEFPTKAKRPGNSKFDLSRLSDVFGVVPLPWEKALAVELDEYARKLG